MIRHIYPRPATSLLLLVPLLPRRSRDEAGCPLLLLAPSFAATFLLVSLVHFVVRNVSSASSVCPSPSWYAWCSGPFLWGIKFAPATPPATTPATTPAKPRLCPGYARLDGPSILIYDLISPPKSLLFICPAILLALHLPIAPPGVFHLVVAFPKQPPYTHTSPPIFPQKSRHNPRISRFKIAFST